MNAKYLSLLINGRYSTDDILYVKNFTNEDVPTLFDLAALSDSSLEQIAPPRWFGGSVRYNFF